jgi:hypothetical protein
MALTAAATTIGFAANEPAHAHKGGINIRGILVVVSEHYHYIACQQGGI